MKICITGIKDRQIIRQDCIYFKDSAELYEKVKEDFFNLIAKAINSNSYILKASQIKDIYKMPGAQFILVQYFDESK